MSKIKEQFFDEINSKDIDKKIDDEYFYNKYLAEMETIKNYPLASCCNTNVSFITVNNETFTICKRCFKFCFVK